ncbi:MAG: hypothetical protein ACREID_00835, partial [Planctomycetota bacterium]
VYAAASLDPEESDLRRIAPDELQRAYHGTSLRVAGGEAEALPQAEGAAEGELSRGLLGGVAGLLFLELLLAWRFQARRRASA